MQLKATIVRTGFMGNRNAQAMRALDAGRNVVIKKLFVTNGREMMAFAGRTAETRKVCRHNTDLLFFWRDQPYS